MKRTAYFLRRARCHALLVTLFLAAAAAAAQPSGWELQNSGTSSWLLGADFVSSTTGWTVGDAGIILKTTSGGLSWVPESSHTSIPLQGVDFIDALNGWAIGGLGTGGIILRTTNGGTSWARQDTGHNLEAVAFVNATTGWAVGAGGLILKTTNGGASWNQVPFDNPSVNFTNLTFVGSDSGWIVGKYPGTVVRTTDGGATWITQTMQDSLYYDIDCLYFADRLNGWIVGQKGDTLTYGLIRHTTDGGITWSDQTSNTDQELLSAGFVSLSEGWCVGTNGVLLHTTNGGNLWLPENSGVSSQLERIVVRANEGGWIVGLGGTILRKDFGGLSQQRSIAIGAGWNMLSLPLAAADQRKTSIFPTASSFAFSYQPPQGYMIEDTLDIGRGYWLKFSSPQTVDVSGSAVTSVQVSLQPGWNLVGSISSDVPVANIIQSPPNSIATIYSYSPANGYQLATLIVNGNAYWMKARQVCQITLQSASVQNIARKFLTDPGLFTTDDYPPPPPGADENQGDRPVIPKEFALHQNYPNPFNPSTNVTFDLPERAVVRVAVYDIMGREVAELANAQSERGVHSYSWGATNQAGEKLASGIYICRMTAKSTESEKEFTGLIKMLLIQ